MKNLPYILLFAFTAFGIIYIVNDVSKKKQAEAAREQLDLEIQQRIEKAKYDTTYNPGSSSSSEYSYDYDAQVEVTDESLKYDIWTIAKKLVPEYTKYPLETELDEEKFTAKYEGSSYQVTGYGVSKNGFGVRVRFVYKFSIARKLGKWELVTSPRIIEQ